MLVDYSDNSDESNDDITNSIGDQLIVQKDCKMKTTPK